MERDLIMSNRRIYDYEAKASLEAWAMDAYIYGYPLVLMAVTKEQMLLSGSNINQFSHQRSFPAPDFTIIVRPNVDTLYSTAWLDLSQGPLLLHVPATHGTYYVLEMLDAWTNVFAAPGTRTTGPGEGVFAITGPECAERGRYPGWHCPD